MTDDNPQSQQSPEDNQQFMPEKRQVLIEQLRKLQHHRRSNIPAEMANKAQGAFNVNPDVDETTGGPSSSSPVAVFVFPQDPFVDEPEIREMNPSDIRPGLVNSRVRVRDSKHPIAEPDESGNYLFWADTPQFSQVSAFYYTTLTLRMFEKFAHRQLPWAFSSPRLYIDPHVGTGMNAFYNEDERLLGFFSFGTPNGILNTAQNADVVSHEAAHAVLDGMRDLYNESFGMGPLAFHESFGDMAAVLVALNDDELVRRLLDWTNGDLRMDNFVSAVAEYIIENMHTSLDVKEVDERTIYLRNALNRFEWKPFDELPYFPEDPRYELGRESHNYSRLFTGAFYDLLVLIYEVLQDGDEMPQRVALYRARDVIGSLLVYAVEVGPVGELKFADMARAFLTADRMLNNGEFADQIIRVFAERKILSEADARQHLKYLDNLPDITLPDYVDSALQSGIFLVDTVLPALNLPDVGDYTPMSAHRNRRGYAFLTYFSVREVILKGERYNKFEGAHIDVFGGITLAFDPEGKLCSALYRPVTDEDVREIQIMTAELIEHGLVTDNSLNGSGRILDEARPSGNVPSVEPRFLYLSADTSATGHQQEPPKLVRVPVIIDAVPRQTERFVEFLKNWHQRSKKDKK